MKKRVVITGIGVITPIGLNVNEFWNNIKADKHGFAQISYFDSIDYKCSLAAEVKGFVGKNHMPAKRAKRLELFCQYAIAATKEALEDSKINREKEDPYRIGCIVGSAVGSIQCFEREYDKIKSLGPLKVSPFFVPMYISNMAAASISINFGLKGKNFCVNTACATGTSCIGEAFRAIQYGEADVMVTGGTESSITPAGIAGFDALNALSTSKDPNRCSIPFDKERNGFIMGEGAGILILEEYEHAIKRGAQIHAEIVGYGSTSDAYHMTSPSDDGLASAKAMTNAMLDAKIEPDSIQYINAHGTGTLYNDLYETRAIKHAFGEHAKKLKVNSTKAFVGHMISAGGAVECITCIKEMKDSYIHKTLGYQSSEEEMDLDYCKEASFETLEYVLSNSLGFGGHNASIILKKYHENV